MRHYISFSGRGGRHFFQRRAGRHQPVDPTPTGSAVSPEEVQHCPLCRRHCPLTEPGCENGREFRRS